MHNRGLPHLSGSPRFRTQIDPRLSWCRQQAQDQRKTAKPPWSFSGRRPPLLLPEGRDISARTLVTDRRRSPGPSGNLPAHCTLRRPATPAASVRTTAFCRLETVVLSPFLKISFTGKDTFEKTIPPLQVPQRHNGSWSIMGEQPLQGGTGVQRLKSDARSMPGSATDQAGWNPGRTQTKPGGP